MKLHFKQYGDHGRPFLILHGLLGSGGNWHTLASRVFAEHYTVYTLDARNHGRSPRVDGMAYPEMASDVAAFMEAHSLGSAVVLGHSMGGKTAMEVALRYPEKVSALIVADMAPRAYPARHDHYIDALLAIDLTGVTSRQEVDAVLAQSVPQTSIRQFLLKNLSFDSAQKTYGWLAELELISRDYPQLNEAIAGGRRFEGPVLFIRGERSDYVQDSDLPAIRDLFPRAEFTTLLKAGHWLHAEAPEEFARAVMTFLHPL